MTHHIPFDTMYNFMVDVFIGIGVPQDEAKTCADVLIASDKRGIDSHGIGRLKPIYYDRIVHQKIQQATTEFEILRDHLCTAVVDGHHGMGMVIAKRCMQMAIDKAKEHGMGMVVARNSTHYGIAGYYPLMATAENMIGISGTNARPSIAPTFGVENMLGTNPVVFGFPTDEPFDFVNDYATSVIQRGKIEQYAREGVDCPEGLIIGRDGKSKTDSAQILKDLVNGEVLSSALQQGAFLKQLTDRDAQGNPKPYQLGHYFIAIDIKCFCDPSDFRKTAGDIMRTLRASEKAPGAERIYTCGQKEYLAGLERAETGIPVNEALQQDMIAMRNELGLDYTFVFE
jgi:L-2-hydroxycarboxylate dehydrogenase (NAD+)